MQTGRQMLLLQLFQIDLSPVQKIAIRRCVLKHGLL